jgi:predicted transcriptional regulator
VGISILFLQLGENSRHQTAHGLHPLKREHRGSIQILHPVHPDGRNAPMPVDHIREIVMEMHQVRYFLAVAEELNFTRASEKCNVTQPSLSRAIKILEEELGGPLFHRERESIHLTDLGNLVRPHLQLVYDHSRLVKHLSQDFVRK